MPLSANQVRVGGQIYDEGGGVTGFTTIVGPQRSQSPRPQPARLLSLTGNPPKVHGHHTVSLRWELGADDINSTGNGALKAVGGQETTLTRHAISIPNSHAHSASGHFWKKHQCRTREHTWNNNGNNLTSNI